jgi:hypothetical protein
MYPTPYVASLRVYEPLEAFKTSDQVRWSQIPIKSNSDWDEQFVSLRRSITSELPNLHSDGAHILVHEGKRYVAPWSTLVRCWAALEDFRFTVPRPVVRFFIPQIFEESINTNTCNLEDKISHILNSTWIIPPRWFALFSTDERLRGTNKYGHFTIFRTSISNAKYRCNFTHQAVVRAFGEGAVEGEVAELLAWLEVFNEKSIVELDYGGLATYLNNQLIENGEEGLVADTSIEDVTTSIAGLASGDGKLAGKGYERLISRWRGVSSLGSAS